VTSACWIVAGSCVLVGSKAGPLPSSFTFDKDGTIADVSPASRVAHRLGKGVERTRSQEGIS